MTFPRLSPRRTYRTYIGNAVSVRDFRVGLRGNRSALLLGLYLFLLIGVSLLVYDSSTASVSLSEAQERLRSFYAAIMGMVTFAACAIATSTGATAIVMEAQRRQLELVTMTAAPPRYLLVGKLVSSFRYTWMVLILSLPITASCVVLGGATWTSVLLTYVLISLFALLCAAIGLAVSTHVSKPTAAIAWAFTGVGAYAILSSALAAAGAAMGGVGLLSGGSSSAPFTILLSPGSVAVAEMLDTTTTLFGATVPNILLAGGTILLVVRYLLHVGGLAIAHRSPRNVAAFRLDSLFTFGLISLALGALVGPLFGTSGTRPLGGGTPSTPSGQIWGWTLVILLLAVVPTVSAYGFDSFKLARPDGVFRIRQTLSGRPSGALPFILLLVLVSAGAHALGFALVGSSVGWQFLLTVGFLLTYAFAIWAFTRNSASSLMGVKQSTTVGIAFTLLFIFGLLALFVTTQVGTWYRTGEQWWYLYPLRPILGDRQDYTNFTHGGFFLLLGLYLAYRGERRLARNLAQPPKINLPPVIHAPAS